MDELLIAALGNTGLVAPLVLLIDRLGRRPSPTRRAPR
jgi:hypothetical protein